MFPFGRREGGSWELTLRFKHRTEGLQTSPFSALGVIWLLQPKTTGISVTGKYLLLSYTAGNNRLKTKVRLVSTLQDTAEHWGKTNWTHPDKIEICLKSNQAQIPKTTQRSTCCLCSTSTNQLWSMFSFKLRINWHSPVLNRKAWEGEETLL